MALDKQSILNELGSVMQQLQSADCGCMSKMFSNSGPTGAPTGNPLPTCGGCRRGCCPGHGYGANYNYMPGGGEPYSMNAGDSRNGMHAGCMHGPGMHGHGMNGHGHGMCGHGMSGPGMFGAGGHQANMDGMHGDNMISGALGGNMNAGGMPGMHGGMRMPCMGSNAPKLYSETYNYLNQNLMQPLVKEVYDDLRSITPANTIGNSPLAAKMGLNPEASIGNPAMAGNQGTMGGQAPKDPTGSMGMSPTNLMNGAVSAGGMGGGPGTNPMNNQMGQQIMNMMMKSGGGGGKPSSMPTGQVNPLKEPMLIDAPQSPHGQIGVTPITPNMNQGMQNPTTQYVTQDQSYTVDSTNASMKGNVMGNMPNQPMTNTMGGNMPGQPMGNTMGGNMPNQQLANTNQSMPQMRGGNPNPYGQHTAGMQKFNEMFPGVMQGDLDFDPMAIAIQMNPKNQQRAAIDTMNKLMSNNKGLSMMEPAVTGANSAAAAINKPNEGQISSTPQQGIAPNSQVIPQNQQQVYASMVGNTLVNQQAPQQQLQGQEYQQGQNIVPNAIQDQEGVPVDPATQPLEQQNVEATRDPIYPVDTSKNNTVGYMMPQYTYNTLGQPIELLNPNVYQKPTYFAGPQTLSGGLPRSEYNVKNTMSKTVLAGNRPLGTTASKSQLQHIYRQYKASHSATQQNIRRPPVQGGSASEGHLNTAPISTPANANVPINQVPVEKVGGDSLATNPNQQLTKLEEINPGQVGDAPTHASNPPQGEKQVEMSPGAMMQKRGRNGLQDVPFTTYRATGGWSFHG